MESAESAEAYRLMALAYIGKGMPEKSDELFAAGMNAPGEKGRLLADYAHLQLEKGNAKRAAELAGMAAAIKPRVLGSYLVSADIAVADGKPAAALAGYESALQYYPESRAALLGKIGVLGGLGKIEQLRPLVENALEKAPGDTDLLYLKARIAAEDEKWGEVRDILQPFEAQLEGLPLANSLYSKSLIEIGQVEQARMRLNSQILRDPSDRQARMLLAEAKLASDDAKGAVETLRPLAARPDATSEELALVSKAARAAGMSDSDVMTNQVVQLVPKEIAEGLARGDAAIKARNWSGAISAYEQILARTDGKNVLVLNNLAYAYSQGGNKTKALDIAKRALELAPGNPSVMDTAGWLMVETGADRSRGIALLSAAADKAPGNPTIRAHLRRAQEQ
jgi:tetratricopeptide (TPR) repeat protein